MTDIHIAQKLQPFSHEMGEFFLFPQTSYIIQVFPTRFFVLDLQEATNFWVGFNWTGPVREFTAQLDLQRGVLSVFGRAKEGYVRYQIFLRDKALCLEMDKIPKGGVEVSSSVFSQRKVEKRELITLVSSQYPQRPMSKERLSLGSHKAQEIVGMRRRLDPQELFPQWLKLAQELPLLEPQTKREGNYLLLDSCKQSKELERFLTFFLSTFTGFFAPSVVDPHYQGILPQGSVIEAVPVLPLLKESAEYIRSFFYQELQPAEISLLPSLPPQLHCGRMIDILTTTGQIVHFEWTKKHLRKVIIESSSLMDLKLWLPKEISSCRIKSKTDTLQKIEVLKGYPIIISLEPKKRVVLDRFEG